MDAMMEGVTKSWFHRLPGLELLWCRQVGCEIIGENNRTFLTHSDLLKNVKDFIVDSHHVQRIKISEQR